jgi:ATP-dependent helicase/nuclease subunit A
MNGRDAVAKKRILSALPLLKDEQALASQPGRQIRLSASAGTGKTQVLSARVLRLLLSGVKPESILCLTFTKAGAAEMADRVHERLGAWVTMDGVALAKDLENLGENIGPEERDKARNLFAKVLDARGSGLRIQTIHGFCQTLLASFPAEAGLPPGFRPVEGREEEQLAAKALADMVEGFEREGRAGDLDRLKSTAKQLSEATTRAFLRKCAAHSDVIANLPIGDGLASYIRVGLAGVDDIDGVLDMACEDGAFDLASLSQLRAILSAWMTKSGTPRADGQKGAERITAWLAATPAERIGLLEELRTAWLTGAGTWRAAEPDDPDYRPTAERLEEWIERLIKLKRASSIAPLIANALRVGQEYAEAYSAAKRAAGVVDFNDLIRSTVRLLETPGIGEWIRFKLDQSVDHILVDEAQDTNADQWSIIKALAGEFFAGTGAKDGIRTIFKVGDFKQAIFGFQGTDPREFDKATQEFTALAEGAGQELLPLSLSKSYRSSQPILDLTDQVLSGLGFAALGLHEAPEQHMSAKGGSGTVTLLSPVTEASGVDEEDASDDAEETDAEEGWIGEAELKWASTLAKQVRGWIKGGLRLRNKDRDVEPGDIMILLRSRGAFARLIVSRLYEEDVPVAGIDRLQLGAPIAVQDLLACMRFVLQPGDDLSLACLLVSPLIGWSQDALYDRAKGRDKVSLWQHLGDHKPDLLKSLLARTDKTTPYQFLEGILSDPVFEGRKKMIARLGEEARDPIEELLNQALAFEEQTQPSLQLFLDWFDRGDVEVKRDPSKPENAVRVMTVHGAKGLQAPVVILADATTDPNFRKPSDLNWVVDGGPAIPLFRPKKGDLIGSLATSAEAQDKRDREEHWRLLYVAMTRAEEHLYVGGALRPKQIKNGMSDACWHYQIGDALRALGAVSEGNALVLRREDKVKPEEKSDAAQERWQGDLPDWAMRSAAPEARPPRPLAPSALETVDNEASPPPTEDMRKAARRGVLLHSLFEKLPGLAAPDRQTAALRWLEHSAGVQDAAERADLASLAIGIIENPDFETFFAPSALAEAPLAGVVAGRVVAGVVDRLLVTDTEVYVIDFKTGRRVPEGAARVSQYHKAQMGAYAAVLADIFVGKTIRAALLYTSGPALIELPPEMIAAYKPGFTDQQQELPTSG